MFTGLITDRSQVIKREPGETGFTIYLQTPVFWKDLKLGESIAINGVCLSLTKFNSEEMCFFVGHETLKKTNFAGLADGTTVNLERSLALGDRLGGHFVLGHVDGIALVTDIEKRGEGLWVSLRIPRNLLHWIVSKGSIAINGVSLTVNELDRSAGTLEVFLIPETLKTTNLAELKKESVINVECDHLVKIVSQQIINESEHADL